MTVNLMLTRQIIGALVLIGISFTFVLIGRDPGWEAFVMSGLVAVGFLIAIMMYPRGSKWVGLLALSVLLLAMFYEPGRPWASVLGLALTALNIIARKTPLPEPDEVLPVETKSRASSGEQ